jgi:hypothetical protein
VHELVQTSAAIGRIDEIGREERLSESDLANIGHVDTVPDGNQPIVDEHACAETGHAIHGRLPWLLQEISAQAAERGKVGQLESPALDGAGLVAAAQTGGNVRTQPAFSHLPPNA